jgi:hypothetical protein
MVTVTGKVVRILPGRVASATGGEATEHIVDLILADARQYWRVSLWDDKPALVRSGALAVGDEVGIENASPARSGADGARRLNAGSYARITKLATLIVPLRDVPAMKLTVLAVARPEGDKVCVAGINEQGAWIRPQGVYAEELDTTRGPLFTNLCVSTVYLDAWRGRHARKEDYFFVYSRGVERELPAEEKKVFLERHVDVSVDTIFKSGRTLGLIKPRIGQVYEERTRPTRSEKGYEQYIRFTFKDRSGRVYRHWSCRCAAFYDTWNAIKARHRWTCGWRMLRYLRRNETYLAIGLTYSDYGVERLEYGAYPMIVGVHVVPPHS